MTDRGGSDAGMKRDRDVLSSGEQPGKSGTRSHQNTPIKPEHEADRAEHRPRKPFDDQLPNIEPLPGEPAKWWNP